MALPGSGQLSINDIAIELQAGESNLSLYDLSTTAGFSSPFAISDFYNFDGYSLIFSSVSAGDPCNAAVYDIYQNIGNLKYYAFDTSANPPTGYNLVREIDETFYEFVNYNAKFDVYRYNTYEFDIDSDQFTNNGITNSACPPS